MGWMINVPKCFLVFLSGKSLAVHLFMGWVINVPKCFLVCSFRKISGCKPTHGVGDSFKFSDFPVGDRKSLPAVGEVFLSANPDSFGNWIWDYDAVSDGNLFICQAE